MNGQSASHLGNSEGERLAWMAQSDRAPCLKPSNDLPLQLVRRKVEPLS